MAVKFMLLLQSPTEKFCSILHAKVAGFHGCTAALIRLPL